MSRQLISRSPDLQRLEDEGYDLEIRSGYLLVKDVPYVNSHATGPVLSCRRSATEDASNSPRT